MTDDPSSRTVQLYCRIEVLVTDPDAVTGRAVAELRAADVDWSTEEDDLDSACAELRDSLTTSLASLADIGRVVDDVPGVEFRGGICWAESGPPREPFPPTDRGVPDPGEAWGGATGVPKSVTTPRK
ncbi:hypothetical protein [Micromonospora cathayae]|uniref:Uncharacterized protein n=1 Tax=Micromonospora cathayae TaxID=3028804 RepID=A0ABY7ZSN6_9ACTN|nr:hypothetical protein [Micromonospora sp. HUAS 3]WDZ86046.1 hypothetical protein PVK37_06365 [Micromonospora sp. HUAS 3]